MSPGALVERETPKTKRCPICSTENGLGAASCEECGHEFPQRPQASKICGSCNAPNPAAAEKCHVCGEAFNQSFSLSLEEALRTGAIARGMDIDEDEVQASEAIAEEIRGKMLKSGDEKIIQMVKVLPDETFARLRQIVS